LEEAPDVAQVEGVALNWLIKVAVAEKLSASRTESYGEHARRASVALKNPQTRRRRQAAHEDGRQAQAAIRRLRSPSAPRQPLAPPRAAE